MIEIESFEKMEEMLRKVVREELQELLIDKEINPKYVDKIKKIREEPYVGFNSVEELDSLVKNA